MSMNKFAFITEGEVFNVLQIDASNGADSALRFIAGLQSNPTVVEIPTDSPVGIFWTYDGAEFHEPTEENVPKGFGAN